MGSRNDHGVAVGSRFHNSGADRWPTETSTVFWAPNVGCVIKASKDERLDLSKLSCPPPIFTPLTWDTALAATPMRTSSSANPSTSADKRDRWRTLRRQRSYSGRGVAYGVPIKDGISTNYNGLERRDSRPFEGVNVTDLPRVIIR